MAEELKCQNCGKGFIPTCHITRQKFCSDACRNRYHSAKGHYVVPVNICPECGDKVEQDGGPGRWRRFCSDQCRVRYHQKKVAEQRAGTEILQPELLGVSTCEKVCQKADFFDRLRDRTYVRSLLVQEML